MQRRYIDRAGFVRAVLRADGYDHIEYGSDELDRARRTLADAVAL